MVPEITVNAGDNIHIYFSIQKANNKLNYYFANNTTGQAASAVVEDVSANTYFNGSKASWVVERLCNRSTNAPLNLANFGTVTFKNCKAMLNDSTTWTNLNSLENVDPKSIKYPAEGYGLAYPSGITNNNQFNCIWCAPY